MGGVVVKVVRPVGAAQGEGNGWPKEIGRVVMRESREIRDEGGSRVVVKE